MKPAWSRKGDSRQDKLSRFLLHLPVAFVSCLCIEVYLFQSSLLEGYTCFWDYRFFIHSSTPQLVDSVTNYLINLWSVQCCFNRCFTVAQPSNSSSTVYLMKEAQNVRIWLLFEMLKKREVETTFRPLLFTGFCDFQCFCGLLGFC